MSSRPAERLSARDLWLLALLTLSWGINWPIMKLGVRDFAPLTFRTMSMVGGIVVLWLLCRAGRVALAVPREHWRELLLLGLSNMVIWFVLSIYGVKLLSSGRAAILGYTLPIWTMLWGLVLFGERPSNRIWVGVGAAAIGVTLLLAGEIGTLTGRPLGTLCMLAAACVWGLGTHQMRRRVQKTPVIVITLWSLVQSVIVCSAIAAWLEHEQWVRWPNTVEWGAIAYNAVVIFGFSQVVWFRLATILPPVASGLSVMMIPVLGLFSGMAILGERPLWQDFVALACILVAIATVLLPARRS